MSRHAWLLIFIFLLSVPIKLLASTQLVWEIDYVPVIQRGISWLDGGAFPASGTLSSVAAFNLPFLVWLQLPVMFFTRHIPTILILTQLIWNFLGTVFVYRLGREMFRPTIGLIGATIFTFTDVSIAGSYTAWAQLLLPTFYVIVLYLLYQWRRSGHDRYPALCLIVTTAAFMTHFSAVLLYGVIIGVGVIVRLPLRWRGLLMGIVASLLMLSPYLAFQVEREFVDLKAFFTRQTTIPQAVLDRYAYLKPEAQFSNTPVSIPDGDDSPLLNRPDDEPVPPSRLERALLWGLSVPQQYLEGMALMFGTQLGNLRTYILPLYLINEALRIGTILLLCGGYSIGFVRFVRHLRTYWRTHDKTTLKDRYASLGTVLVTTEAGSVMFILVFVLILLTGLIITRASPSTQPTYYTGLLGIELLVIAYALTRLLEKFVSSRSVGKWLLIGLVASIAILPALDRVVRVTTHNDEQFTPFNVWLYSSMEDATDWIADDWDDGDSLTVAYDILPELPQFWWVAPWHTIDETYRIGMAYDALLEINHGLTNLNASPVGIAELPDYLIVFEHGLSRYEVDDYQVETFGAIHVLKPKE